MTTPTFPPCPFDAAIRNGEPLPSLSIRHQVPPRGHSFFHDAYRHALASGIVAHAECIAHAVRKAAAAMIRDAGLRAESRELTLADIVAELDGTQWGPDTVDTVASILRAAGFTIRELDASGKVDPSTNGGQS